MGALAIALRRRFKTPADAIRALGLDPALLHDKAGPAAVTGDAKPRSTTMPTPARRYDPIITRGLGRQVRRAALGMDALIGGRRVGRDDDPVSVEDCCAVIRGMLRALPPEDGVELLERMRDMADSGDPEVAAELGAEDDPPDFPGMPRTGGTTPSATRPSLAPNGSAQDSAPRGGLYDRFPNAKRIGFGY